MGRRLRAALFLGLSATAASGCVDGDYGRTRIFQPPLPAAVDALEPGRTELGEALASLGAPVQVIEVGLGMALAWGWTDVTDWNIDISAPIGDAQGNFSFTSSDTTTRGLVLFFDADWRLERVEQGFLSQLLPARLAPRDVDDDLREE